MKRFHLIFAVIASSLLLAGNANAYKPEQLEKFEAHNNCNGCDLSGAGLTSNHSNAALNGADLSNVYPVDPNVGINFNHAQLPNANLTGANLVAANLSFADLTGALLFGTHLSRANMYGATIDLTGIPVEELCGAILPDGKKQICL